MRFLVNPSAGGGRARRAMAALESAASALGAPLEISESRADLVQRARRAVEEGVGRLVVVGGDGTVHLALQALGESSCELAVIPTGRGDDFAMALGVPASIQEALELARDGGARDVDLLRIARPDAAPIWGGIYAGLGFDSAVTRTANAQPRGIPRRITYVLAAVRTLVRFHAPRFTVEHDGERVERRAMLVTACNAPIYGGGMRIAPGAEMSDGLLDVVTVDEIPKPALLWLFPRVFSGTHVEHPAVSVVRTRRVRFVAEPGALLASDGEIEGEVGAEGVEITVARGAARVVTPGIGAGRE